jgi:hypothetical protein
MEEDPTTRRGVDCSDREQVIVWLRKGAKQSEENGDPGPPPAAVQPPCRLAKTTFLFFFPVIIESVSVVSRQLGELFDVARIRKEAPFPSCGSIGKTSSRRPLFRTVGAAPLNSSFLTGHDSHVMEFISE